MRMCTRRSEPGQSPVMHLKQRPKGPMWQHYKRSFERTWSESIPETA